MSEKPWGLSENVKIRPERSIAPTPSEESMEKARETKGEALTLFRAMGQLAANEGQGSAVWLLEQKLIEVRAQAREAAEARVREVDADTLRWLKTWGNGELTLIEWSCMTPGQTRDRIARDFESRALLARTEAPK